MSGRNFQTVLDEAAEALTLAEDNLRELAKELRDDLTQSVSVRSAFQDHARTCYELKARIRNTFNLAMEGMRRRDKIAAK